MSTALTPECTCDTIGPHGHNADCPSTEAAEWAAECEEFGCHEPDEQDG